MIFTIFDCWNAKFYNKIMDKTGKSMSFIHSQKRFDYFEYLKSYFISSEIKFQKV